MRLNPFCMCCIANKQEKSIRPFGDEERKADYMKKVFGILSNAGDEDCTASLAVDIRKVFEEYWDVREDYTEIKHQFNQLMLRLEPGLEEAVRSSEDPLKTALLYARIGNYIDFAALSHVDKDQVLSMIKSENKDPLDHTEYENFCQDLSKAKSFVYLTDNCGEIVLDKIAVKVIKERFPHLDLHVIVRGAPVVNDATMEDAIESGLTDIAKVMGNGSDVGGTWLSGINQEAKTLIQGADVLLAKGQGNFETLHQCGLNIYYLFLCKCQWFTTHFHARHLQGMFVNEKRI